MTRTVLETMRTLFVWVLDLLLFYAGPTGAGWVGGWGMHPLPCSSGS